VRLISLFLMFPLLAFGGAVELGPRPYYLVDSLHDGPLKSRLSRCAEKTDRFRPTVFSIGHRGAPLQFPEHTEESYRAAARMGAGIVECDVTFTKDKTLVCRHSQCDLHTTTNILETPLAKKCSAPFEPAVFEAGERMSPATATCCTSDLTVDEFLSLEGKMDYADTSARTVSEYVRGSAPFRTELYATGGTLMTHAQSIALLRELGVKMTPELKEPLADMPFNGMTREGYALKLIDEYRALGVDAVDVYPQSFFYEDLRTWLEHAPDFAERAVLLDGRDIDSLRETPPTLAEFQTMKSSGVNIIAPPIPVLLTIDKDGQLAPSDYARRAKEAGLSIIAWTIERSGRIDEDVKTAGGAYYFDGIDAELDGDGGILTVIDALADDVGAIGVFSDWPATTTFYANCMGED